VVVWIEVAILALATWPALRMLSVPRTLFAYTGLASIVGAILLAYASVVAELAIFAPALLHPLAGLAAGALIVERWRARPAYGAARGLPPGSLTVFPRGPWVNDRFFLEQAARYGPLFKFSLQYRPCLGVLGGRLGSELLRANAHDLEAPLVRFARFIPKGPLRYMHSEEHPFYHRSFLATFARPVGRQNHAMLSEIARTGLANLARESAQSPAVGVAPQPALREIIFELLVASFFALRPDDSDFAWLRARYQDLDLHTVSLVPESRDRRALAEIEAWVRARGLMFQEAVARGDEAPPCFLTALLEAHPGALDDETALGNLVYALTIATVDLTGLMMWTLKLLGDSPEWVLRLRETARAEPAGRAHVLAWCIVRETLRLEQSEHVYRIAKREIQFHGFTIPKNWRIRVLIREGHQDPAHFQNPDCFDPGRWLDPEKPSAHYMPFGLDSHACIGVPVTESVSCLLLTELGRAYDWRLLSDGPRQFGWAHWEPSSKLRIALVARNG
jgi:ent-kaurenoic acid hydroxylase